MSREECLEEIGRKAAIYNAPFVLGAFLREIMMEEILKKFHEEYWNDKEFIEKRVNEQHRYIVEICKKFQRGEILKDRRDELIESAEFVYRKFRDRERELWKEELNSGVA